MKKIVAIFIVLVCICSSVVAFADADKQYECSDWAKESVDRAFDAFLLDGEKEYKFKEDISRLDFCSLIFNLVIQTPYFYTWCEENLEEDDTEFPSFIDKPFSDTEDVGVLFLHHIGIINGKSKTEFAPNDKLTCEEAATIIVRMIDITTPMDSTEAWYEYNDLSDISDWAMSSVQRISNLGFMKGVGENKFAPKDTYTTEQAVVTVVRVFDANFINWIVEIMKKEAGELGYVYENDTWNYVTYDMAVGRRVTPIDVDKDEFELLEYENFARDNENVYFMAHKIEGSDPDTFEVISTKDSRNYAKDKNFVYIYLRDGGGVFKVIGADPTTFEVLEFPYAKDKNDAYNGCLPLYVDDVTKFEVIEGGGMSRISPVETFLGTIINSEDVAKYNNEKYGFVDGAVLYSDEGKAKTEKLYYEGYRLVEDKRLTQFNDDNKSPKALLPANEMISDCLEEYTVEWYSEISSIMINNDDLLKKDVIQEYIIANSLSFQGIEYINIKVFDDETGEMTYKFYNSEFENEGEMIINKNISLTKKQAEQVVNIFEKNHFWDIPSRHPEEEPGLDGNTIFIEGINKNKYNIISMWCPDDKYEIKKIYDETMSLANLCGLATR